MAQNGFSSFMVAFNYHIKWLINGKYNKAGGFTEVNTTRTEAEEKAFEKAFEILENKL